MEKELTRNNYQLERELPKIDELERQVLLNAKKRIFSSPAMVDSFGLFYKQIKDAIIPTSYKIYGMCIDNNNRVWAVSANAEIPKRLYKINRDTNIIEDEITLDQYDDPFFLTFDGIDRIWINLYPSLTYLTVNIHTNAIKQENRSGFSPLVILNGYAYIVNGFAPLSISKFSLTNSLEAASTSVTYTNVSSVPSQSMTTDGEFIYVTGQKWFGGASYKTFIRTFDPITLASVSYWESSVDPSTYGAIYFDGTHIWQVAYNSTTLRKFSIASGVLTNEANITLANAINSFAPFMFNGNKHLYVYSPGGGIAFVVNIETNTVDASVFLHSNYLNPGGEALQNLQTPQPLCFDGTYLWIESSISANIRKTLAEFL